MALITSNGYEGISSPVVNTAFYLAKKGFSVDIYVSRSSYCEDLGLDLRLNHPGIKVIKIKEIFYRFFGRLSGYVRDLEFCFNVIRMKGKYDFLIGYEQHGLVRAALLGNIWNRRYVYHSLEFYEKRNLLKFLECHYMKKATVNLTQDYNRVRIMSTTCGIPKEMFMVSVNSSLGNVLKKKKNYFRDRFGIGMEKYIVLFTGSIIEQCYIREVIESVKRWPKQFVLVIHGWIPDDSLRPYIEDAVKQNPDKIFLSTDIIQFEEKYTIFQSVDVGLVLFSPINLNMKYAAGSAGKLYDFMRTGVPVIANRIPGMSRLVLGNDIGEIIESCEEIPKALRKISSSYERYRESAFKVFPKYEFSVSYDKIMKRIMDCMLCDGLQGRGK